tara:strand:+ start:387 stop:611 length:225 start_codon:yes stop_codon:yes gene_type:complete
MASGHPHLLQAMHRQPAGFVAQEPLLQDLFEPPLATAGLDLLVMPTGPESLTSSGLGLMAPKNSDLREMAWIWN